MLHRQGAKSAIVMPAEKIAEFCRRHQIRRLSLFGSVLREDFTPESDIDFLVEFLPNTRTTYLDLAGMEIELSELLAGRKVDLRTPAELSPHFRASVLAEAVIQYEQN